MREKPTTSGRRSIRRAGDRLGSSRTSIIATVRPLLLQHGRQITHAEITLVLIADQGDIQAI